MPKFQLEVLGPQVGATHGETQTFTWSENAQRSVEANLTRPTQLIGPRLDKLGKIAQGNVEFVRVATAIYAADKSSLRRAHGADWSSRRIEVTVPVWDVTRWSSVAHQLGDILGFLSGDQWRLQFVQSPDQPPEAQDDLPDFSRVILLSGGADSFCGALRSRADDPDSRQLLVSHYSWTNVAPLQRSLVVDLHDRISGSEILHRQLLLKRGNTDLVSGKPFANEYSSRTRSMLFIALGLAFASIRNVELWIPENGFASLNPPLAAERRGALSTRTTNPKYLTDLRDVLQSIGVHADYTNPFMSMSKGEVFLSVAAAIGPDAASDALSRTHSCAHSGSRTLGLPALMQCGVCFGCAVRRAAFLASGLDDKTEYAFDQPMTDRLQRYLNAKTALPTIDYFVARGVQLSDIAKMSLPSSYSFESALQLCRKGASELGLLNV